MWTEAQVIECIAREFPTRNDVTIRGIGDDCAILRAPHPLITTDASIEGVHFDLNWMDLADAAYRCLTSNISDIAAMGAFAGAFTLALGLSPDLPFEAIEEAIKALKTCIEDHQLDNCTLIGGDVVRSAQVVFSITMMGQNPPWPCILRTGAKPGDAILALGNLGFSAAGLELLQAQQCGLEIPETYFPFLQAFKRPKALSHLGTLLAKNHLPSAMMDISDGIRTDLPRLMQQSQCAAQVDFGSFIPGPKISNVASFLDKDPIDWMTSGGEDFGLLMTCDQNHVMSVFDLAKENRVSCFLIGTCQMGCGVQWFENHRPATRPDKSFTHF